MLKADVKHGCLVWMLNVNVKRKC